MAGNASLLESDVLLGLLENLDSQDPAHCHDERASYEVDQGQDGPFAVVGPSTEELESLKELIRFDHEYVKRPPVPTPTIVIEQEKTENSVAIKPEPREPVVCLDMEDSVVNLTSGEDSSASALEFRSQMLPSKAEAALENMLVSLNEASLSLHTKDTTVPNLLSIDDGVFDCDISDMLGLDPEVTSCDAKSETGSSADSAFNDTPASPFSDGADLSPNLGDNIWEESFTDLFPSFDYL